MTTLERALHNVDIICADLQAAVKDAVDAAQTPGDLAFVDERLSVTAHWLANQRQIVVARRALLPSQPGTTPVTESLDTTGGA